MRNLLEVDSVMVAFDNRNVLNGCYFKCETGDIIGLLGRNGCGKSSLLKIVFGTLSTHNKFIRINQKVYDQLYKHTNLIAYLPQHDFLPKNLSVRKIIYIYIHSASKRDTLLGDCRIKYHLDKRISELSGGELRYLEISLLVNLDVKFILLDEPFSKVEPLFKDVIVNLIKEYSSTIGFVITDHDYTNIIAASNQIILINNGVCKPINDLLDLERYSYVPLGTFS